MSSPPREWSWEAYEQELGYSAEKLQTAKACFMNIQNALTHRGLNWRPAFRNGYFGFFREGNYYVVTAGLGTRSPLVAVKLPEAPERLGLESPYPGLEQDWNARDRQWGWFVPDVESVPDFGLAIDLSRPYQPETGPMRPPASTAAGKS